MRRYLQFSVLSIFGIVTVAAIASYWLAAHRRNATAEDEYLRTKAGFSAGMKTKEDIYRTSVEWLNAGLAIPFCDRRKLYGDHLARMTALEEWFQGEVRLAMDPSGRKEAQLEAEEATGWRKEAEKWARQHAK